MSLTALGPPARPPVATRLAVAALALAAMALVMAAILHLAGPSAAPAPPAPRNPFSGGALREAAPSASGIGGLILAWQSAFYVSLRQALSALREGGGVLPLAGLAFAYGVFHAAGPGHGKAVISAYIVASGGALRRGAALSLAAALVQAVVAIALVGIFALALGATAARINAAMGTIETASFAAIAAFGLWLLWRQAGRLLSARADAAALACDDGCAHGPSPADAMRPATLRETIGIVLAAGSRPCAGAVIVLVFALSQGLVLAGIAAVFAMALGTAMTTAALAALAVYAKRAALAVAGGAPGRALLAGAAIELAAAAFVALLGLSLLAGLWAGGSPG